MNKESSDWKFIKTKVFISFIITIAIIVIIFFTWFLGIIPVLSGSIFTFFLGTLLAVILIGIKDSLEQKRAGLYLGPFQIQVLRAAVSLGVGQIIAGTLAIIDRAGNSTPLTDD